MTVTIADEAETRSMVRASLAGDYASASAWIATNLAATLPPGIHTVQLEVPRGLTHEQKLDWVRGVAESWKTRTAALSAEDRGKDGLVTEKRFGQFRFVASVGPEYASHAELLDAARARRAREATAPEGPAAA